MAALNPPSPPTLARRLWRGRGVLRRPLGRAEHQRERAQLLARQAPALLLLAALVGAMLFAALPPVLNDGTSATLGALWPLWVWHAAPLLVAGLGALPSAPALGARWRGACQRGERTWLDDLSPQAAAWPLLPWLAAQADAAALGLLLLVGASALIGVALAALTAVTDPGLPLGAVLDSVPPWLYGAAALRAAVCAAATTAGALWWADRTPTPSAGRSMGDLAAGVAGVLLGMALTQGLWLLVAGPGAGPLPGPATP